MTQQIDISTNFEFSSNHLAINNLYQWICGCHKLNKNFRPLVVNDSQPKFVESAESHCDEGGI